MSSANAILTILLVCNLLKYVDRLIIAPVLPLIGREFGASDLQLGAVASAFMLVYMFAAPIWGLTIRPGGRPRTLAIGVALGAVATAAAGFARTLTALIAARALLAIGQAGFTAAAPSFVAEQFPERERTAKLSIYESAIPVGSAIGFVLGGWIGHLWGWRAAFLCAAAATTVFAPMLWNLRDPLREVGLDPARPIPSDYLRLYRIPSYAAASFAQAALTFAMGGLAIWIPTFLFREHQMSVSAAGIVFGAVTVLGGLTGALAGGRLATRLRRRTAGADFLVSGAGLLAALPLGWAALFASSKPAALVLFFLCEACIFLHMGPLDSILVAVVPAGRRALGFAANIFVIHAFGDALSPAIIGLASDVFSLRRALAGALCSVAVGAALCFWGAARLERDSDSARRAAHA